MGDRPVGLALVKKPEEPQAVEVAAVPFPYGATVTVE